LRNNAVLVTVRECDQEKMRRGSEMMRDVAIGEAGGGMGRWRDIMYDKGRGHEEGVSQRG
jgi:hypothetical protein